MCVWHNDLNYNNPKMPKKEKPPQDPILTDPLNTFRIKNPENLPFITLLQKAETDKQPNRPINPNNHRKLLEQLLHSTTIVGFRNKANRWVNAVDRDLGVKEFVIRVKEKQNNPVEVNDTGIIDTKYEIELYPKYTPVTFNHYLSHKVFNVSATLSNLTKSSIKNMYFSSQWNYRLKQFELTSQLKFYSPWFMKWGKKWGKPIQDQWVADCRQFKVGYKVKEQAQYGDDGQLKSQTKEQLAIGGKGYVSRLKHTARQQTIPGIYSKDVFMKNVDLLQIGYKHRKFYNQGASKYLYKITMGSDYYSTWYLKFLAKHAKYFPISQNVHLLTQSEVGVIAGKDVLPHEMFNRNEMAWLGDRSKAYAHVCFNFVAQGVDILKAININPVNYLGIWLSKSYQDRVKIQAELGIGIRIVNTMLKLNWNLFRVGGEIRDRGVVGIKYQF